MKFHIKVTKPFFEILLPAYYISRFSLIVFIMFISSFLTGIIHEVSALSPTVGYFVGIGMANIKSDKKENHWETLLYILALIGTIILNFVLNIFA